MAGNPGRSRIGEIMSDTNKPGGASGFPAPVPGGVPQDVKNLAMISTLGMILVGFLSPLIVFLMTNDDPSKKFANDHAKAGLNFSIVFFAGMVISAILILVIVGILTLMLLIAWSIWVIIAGAIQASNGEEPHYPLVPNILK